MTVAEIIEALQGFEESIQVTAGGYRVKSIDGDTYYDENTGEEYSEIYIRTEKEKVEHRRLKCPFRKITTNVSFKMNKEGNMSPMKTVEEFGPCYKDNCPYYDTIFSSEGEFRCRKVGIEESKAK